MTLFPTHISDYIFKDDLIEGCIIDFITLLRSNSFL